MKQFILLTLLLSSPLCAGPVTATILGAGTGLVGFATYLLGKSGKAGVAVATTGGQIVAGPIGSTVAGGVTVGAQYAVEALGDEGSLKAISTSATAAAAFGMLLPLP